MAETTEKYGLRTPSQNEFFDVKDISENMEKLEGALTEFDDSGTVEDIKSFPDFLTKLVTGNKLAVTIRNLKAGLQFVLHAGQIVNNCVTDNAGLPLSAAQGKALMDKYTQLYSDATGKRLGENYIMNYSDFSDPLVSQYQISSLASDPYGNAPASNVGDFRILRLGNSIEKFNTLILTSPRFKSTSSMSQEFYIGNFWDGVWMGWERLANKSALDSLASMYNTTRANYGKGSIFLETIKTFSSPTQLTHAGFFKLETMTADVNADAKSETMTEYATGDFYGLLLGSDVNITDGCNYGTLIVTSPRINNGIWLCTIWERKIIHWHKIKVA